MQKPRVAKHYEFQCRTAPFLSCVDCFKDFRGEEYTKHTKCISEAQRYGGKDYVPKAGANKGERKQQEWLNVVNSILSSTIKLTNAENSFLRTLSKFENIPRKKAKFLNFVRSAMGNKYSAAVVESVWNVMETHKNNSQSATEKQQEADGKVDQNVDNKKNMSKHQENNVIENQNNENIHRENQNGDQQNKSNETHDADNVAKKKKKSKKRTVSETVEQANESVSHKKQENGSTEEPVPKKKSKSIVPFESSIDYDDMSMDNSTNQCNDTIENSTSQCDDTMEKSSFDWKGTILEIVQSKGEVSLKKLQKKVISQYLNSSSDTIPSEKASSKFNKKLKKISEVVVSDDKVKLA